MSNIEKPNAKIRLGYIDIAKGILICCLLYSHIRVYGPMEGMQDVPMRIMSHTGGLYGAFFMQSFFIITGFCTSFDVDNKSYIWKNIKTLLLPSILLFLFSEYYKQTLFESQFGIEPLCKLFQWITTGGPWFIIAMFWAKLIYYPITKLSYRLQLPTVGTMYLVALVCAKYEVPNYQWFQHTLLLLPYLMVGKWCKENWRIVETKIKYIALFGCLSIVIQNIICQLGFFSLPEHDFAICISLKNFPLHILNSVTGTAFVIYISKLIVQNRFLQTMGTGTLIIYLWNGIVYRTIVRMMMIGYLPDKLIFCTIFHIVALSLCYVSFYFIIRLIYQHKSLNWIVGKW